MTPSEPDHVKVTESEKKPLMDQIRGAVDEVVGKLAEFLNPQPQPQYIPVRVRRPMPRRR